MEILSIISTKGGVGKTTLAANLAAILADMGLRICMIDTDFQANLSHYYPILQTAPKGLGELILNNKIEDHEALISKTVFTNLDIIMANVKHDEEKIEMQNKLANRGDRLVRLKIALDHDYFHENYDYIIIDTQGAVGVFQDAAIFAATRILLPIPPDTLSSGTILNDTLSTIRRVEEESECFGKLGTVQALIYRQDRTRNAKEISNQIKEFFHENKSNITLLKTVIPAAKAYSESTTAKYPVHCFDIANRNKAESAYFVMHNLAHELLSGTRLDDVFADCFGGKVIELMSMVEK